jgi:hypothetical protein
MAVKIIDRRNSETNYSYVIPGHSDSSSHFYLNCDLGTVRCSGSASTHEYSTEQSEVSYDVVGATFSLLLTDGRIAVVNCESKFKEKMDYINRRDCRMPLVNDIQVEFKGKDAKLIWPVSIDGKKFESETYKILAVLEPEKQTVGDNGSNTAQAQLKSDAHESPGDAASMATLPKEWVFAGRSGSPTVSYLFRDDYVYESEDFTNRRGFREKENCVTKRTGDRWVGKCTLELFIVDNGRTHICSLDLDEVITSISPVQITGESQEKRQPQNGELCPTPANSRVEFVNIPKN